MSDLGLVAGSAFDELTLPGVGGVDESDCGRFPADIARAVFDLGGSFVPGFFCIANPFN
jgi:hypothetical protein